MSDQHRVNTVNYNSNATRSLGKRSRIIDFYLFSPSHRRSHNQSLNNDGVVTTRMLLGVNFVRKEYHVPSTFRSDQRKRRNIIPARVFLLTSKMHKIGGKNLEEFSIETFPQGIEVWSFDKSYLSNTIRRMRRGIERCFRIPILELWKEGKEHRNPIDAGTKEEKWFPTWRRSNYLDEFRAGFVAIDRLRDKVKNIYLHAEMHYTRLGPAAPCLYFSLPFLLHFVAKVAVDRSEIYRWNLDPWR